MKQRKGGFIARVLVPMLACIFSWINVTNVYANPPCTGGGSNASVWGSCSVGDAEKPGLAVPRVVHERRYVACSKDATTQAMCAAADCPFPLQLGPVAQIVQINVGGTWSAGTVLCSAQFVAAAAPPPPPQVTVGDAQASVVKLLPNPVIGTAPPATATPLVHVQIITWIKTQDGQVPLGSATLLGRHVDFRGQVQTVKWNFGDGSSDTSDGPGRAYDFDVNPCRTYLCPGYFGHVYTKSGSVNITARATWVAQFRVDGGAWQDIGTVQGNVGQLTMTIHSARTILVR